ncbi:hypothetical protein F5Y11DRAFT_132183 [Daldinia sp. FL1419]|nr:hypothetical protein F5Y11DRAFT_132183 [Daldinia sp. FL1419]
MPTGKSSGGSWSPQEKLELLLQIVEHLNGSGRSIPFSEIHMPGRTTKSLQHTWKHLRDEAAAYRNGKDDNSNTEAAAATDGNGANKTPSKTTTSRRRSSRSRTQKRPFSEWLSDDEEDMVSIKKARLSSDEEKEQDSEVENVAVTKSKPVSPAKRAKNGESKIKFEDPTDYDTEYNEA